MDKEIKRKMRLLWDDERNLKLLGAVFEDINSKQTSSRYWKCDFSNSSCPPIKKSVRRVYQALRRGTPICSCCKGHSFKGSVQDVVPDLVAKYWDFERNIEMGFFPNIKRSKSNDKIFVRCEKHNFGITKPETQLCSDFTERHIKCPQCNGKKASSDNNLKIRFPLIAKELHPDFDPLHILPFSSKKLPWLCERCKKYYKKEVRLRTAQNQGCPIHNTKHLQSKTESLIRLILNAIFGNFKKYYFNNLSWASGQSIEIDNYNEIIKVGVEYDGHYHKDKKQIIRDQFKNDLLNNYKNVSLFIRIRDRDLPKLKYYGNQFEFICDKHEYTYNFLVPAIQQTIRTVGNKSKLNVKSYSDDELKAIIKELLPKANNNAYYIENKISFAEHAPGLLKHLEPNNIDPYFISKGSNHILNVKCPHCKENFNKNKSMAKNLIYSRGKCDFCSYYVEDIHDIDSPLKKWSREVTFEKSLKGKNSLLAKFYSEKNIIPADKIAYKSHYTTIWNCPFCLKEYESKNNKQINNGCKCKHCGKKALNHTKEN